MYDDLKAVWNRDRISEIRNEFHWMEFFFGFTIGMAALMVLILTA